MANQKSLGELIDKAEAVHKDMLNNPLYSYENIKYPYQNNGVWDIDCLRHNFSFQQNFRKHLSGQTGCKECVSEKKAKNNLKERSDRFLQRAKVIHSKKIGGKPLYDYSKVKYVSNHVNVIICCPIHGDFPMTPGNHTHKTKPQQCPKCSGRNVRTKEDFILEAQQIHKDGSGNPLYDYSGINYIDTTKHISILCKKHNKYFRQRPAKHLYGQKCPDCSKEIVAKKNTMTTEEFIIAAQKRHKDAKGNPKYDYSQVEYKNNHTNVTIICPYHGTFKQSPSVHKDGGSGCKSCRSSKGEQIIAEFLSEKNIQFEREYKFDDCRFKRPLPFDFKLDWEGTTMLIEYHGEIHFKPGNYSKDIKKSKAQLKDRQARDKFKKEYAINRGIKFIEFNYKQDYYEIRQSLSELFNC